MKSLSITEAESELEKWLQEVENTHQPLQIIGKSNKAVLISDEEWENIQETLYLLSIPGLGAKIKEGLETPLSECKDDLPW